MIMGAVPVGGQNKSPSPGGLACRLIIEWTARLPSGPPAAQIVCDGWRNHDKRM